MDGTMFLHHPRTHEIVQAIARGDLGQVASIHSDFSFYLPKDATDIRLDKSLEPLGALGDVGWYTARLTLVATSYELPEKVFASATMYNGVIYSLNAIMLFKDGRRATFDCGFDSCVSQNVKISGPGKSLTLNDFVIPWKMEPFIFPQVTPATAVHYYTRDGSGVVETHTVEVGPRTQESRLITEFGSLALKKKADREFAGGDKWARESHATMRLLDALAESARTGVFVNIA